MGLSRQRFLFRTDLYSPIPQSGNGDSDEPVCVAELCLSMTLAFVPFFGLKVTKRKTRKSAEFASPDRAGPTVRNAEKEGVFFF